MMMMIWFWIWNRFGNKKQHKPETRKQHIHTNTRIYDNKLLRCVLCKKYCIVSHFSGVNKNQKPQKEITFFVLFCFIRYKKNIKKKKEAKFKEKIRHLKNLTRRNCRFSVTKTKT